MSTLHIFDMDGTLVRGSACLDISRHLGQIERVNEIEQAWSRGEVGHVAFYELCLPLWEGLTEADVDLVFAAGEWIAGVPAVFADIATRGEYSAVITLSPQFYADRLLAWGAGSVHGAEVYGGIPPIPEQVMTPESKIDVATALMTRYDLGPDDVIAYGDSASDIPLFEHLPKTVAINGSDSARSAATITYEGSDLRDAYALAREHFIERPCAAAAD
ncbi:unannotated protein [freshwater metagenome]|uniref:Unannotated protein n=1 Tax=freshwater metagenome TaxID=449393 RepID=A0A6J7CUP8_9ZZZZ|nr:HAD hydrolase family protein [Actinomycetota bacterium]